MAAHRGIRAVIIRPMVTVALLGSAGTMASTSAHAQTATAAQSGQLKQLDAIVSAFFKVLISGQDGASATIFAGSPLWAGKQAEQSALDVQIKAAVAAYGPARSYELVSEDIVGTSAVRRYYIVHHDKMALRWEFDFVRTSKGWVVGYIGYEDQVRTWFKG